MRRLGVVAVAALAVCACSSAAAPTMLKVFAQSGNLIDAGSSKGVTYTIEFDSTGLVSSFREVGARGENVRTFRVSREGDNVTVNYGENDLSTWPSAFTVTTEGVTTVFDGDSKGTSQTVVKASPQTDSAAVYQRIVHGVVFQEFRFAVGETGLVYPPTGEAFSYSVDASSRHTTIGSSSTGSERYVLRWSSTAKVTVDLVGPDDMVFWRFQVTGTPLRTDPVTAIVNVQLIGAGPIMEAAIWPFIGGSPR
jgi:hypothetical protein